MSNVIPFPVIARRIPDGAPQIYQDTDPALTRRVEEIVERTKRLLQESKNDRDDQTDKP